MEAHLTRREDWPVKLSQFIDSQLDTPFSWDGMNCGVFVAEAVNAITVNPIEHRIFTDAIKLYASGAYLPIVQAIAAKYGCEEIPPLNAKRGDVVMFGGLHGETLGVCVGSMIAGPGVQGLTMIEMSKATKAWKVG